MAETDAATLTAPHRIRNIQELAKIAGVSAGTVSRALAGMELVNKATRERIQAIAREHGFRPNQMARNLRTQKTGVIGVVIPLYLAECLGAKDRVLISARRQFRRIRGFYCGASQLWAELSAD